ncbi:DUF222 domain-containing protein, partial [Kribbella sp. NPDC051952]|uniref:HNH endonuclease n=1 Tax=Kribbella sp. NPDC051952 TaxID=3154851 RepID=UPI00343464F0
RSRIHAGARPHKTVDGELDPRSREKRQADALTSTLTIAAAAADVATTSDTVPGFGAKATITVTIDYEDLKAATATGNLVYGDNLSAATIRRLACDAKIIPLVLGSNSEPLDIGRAERLVTRAMRRALNARDNGCVICGAPPITCDAHHLKSWLDGGETATNNLALLCRRHHVALHNGHWTITITNGHPQVTRPPWATPPPHPKPPITSLLKPLPTPTPPTPTPTRPTTRNPRPSRWSADETAMHQATQFAAWGTHPTPQHQPQAP